MISFLTDLRKTVTVKKQKKEKALFFFLSFFLFTTGRFERTTDSLDKVT